MRGLGIVVSLVMLVLPGCKDDPASQKVGKMSRAPGAAAGASTGASTGASAENLSGPPPGIDSAAECAKVCSRALAANCKPGWDCQAECVQGLRYVGRRCADKLKALLACRQTAEVICASGRATQPACEEASRATETCG